MLTLIGETTRGIVRSWLRADYPDTRALSLPRLRQGQRVTAGEWNRIAEANRFLIVIPYSVHTVAYMNMSYYLHVLPANARNSPAAKNLRVRSSGWGEHILVLGTNVAMTRRSDGLRSGTTKACRVTAHVPACRRYIVLVDGADRRRLVGRNLPGTRIVPPKFPSSCRGAISLQ